MAKITDQYLPLFGGKMNKFQKCLKSVVIMLSLMVSFQSRSNTNSDAVTLPFLAPVYNQFPQMIGVGHSTWSVDEHKFLRQAWLNFFQEGPKSWAPSEVEWKTIHGRAEVVSENKNLVIINGHNFYPDKETMNSELLARVEKAIDIGLDYEPSLLDFFVPKAGAQGSLLSRQLSYKVLFTIAALKTCSEMCNLKVPKVSIHKQ